MGTFIIILSTMDNNFIPGEYDLFVFELISYYIMDNVYL